MTDVSTPVSPQSQVVQIDIISDVMCPWCIVGYRQLEMALASTGTGARVRWHPFELNPDMGPDGENLGDHIHRKYGSSPEDSARNRDRLKQIGEDLGISFNFTEDSKIVNSFMAHKLLDFAAVKGLQHPLKLALFDAHFREGADVSDPRVLVQTALSVGLNEADVRTALASDAHAKAVRAQQAIWHQNGISGVPTMIFDEKYLISGAQGPDNYARMLRKVASEAA